MHEHACFVSGFGTFFRYATCMLQLMHVTCMMSLLHVLFMLHACLLCGIECMVYTCSYLLHACIKLYVVHTNMHPNILAMHGTWMYSSERTICSHNDSNFQFSSHCFLGSLICLQYLCMIEIREKCHSGTLRIYQLHRLLGQNMHEKAMACIHSSRVQYWQFIHSIHLHYILYCIKYNSYNSIPVIVFHLYAMIMLVLYSVSIMCIICIITSTLK